MILLLRKNGKISRAWINTTLACLLVTVWVSLLGQMMLWKDF